MYTRKEIIEIIEDAVVNSPYNNFGVIGANEKQIVGFTQEASGKR